MAHEQMFRYNRGVREHCGHMVFQPNWEVPGYVCLQCYIDFEGAKDPGPILHPGNLSDEIRFIAETHCPPLEYVDACGLVLKWFGLLIDDFPRRNLKALDYLKHELLTFRMAIPIVPSQLMAVSLLPSQKDLEKFSDSWLDSEKLRMYEEMYRKKILRLHGETKELTSRNRYIWFEGFTRYLAWYDTVFHPVTAPNAQPVNLRGRRILILWNRIANRAHPEGKGVTLNKDKLADDMKKALQMAGHAEGLEEEVEEGKNERKDKNGALNEAVLQMMTGNQFQWRVDSKGYHRIGQRQMRDSLKKQGVHKIEAQSLDKPFGKDGNLTLLDTIPDKKSNTADKIFGGTLEYSETTALIRELVEWCRSAGSSYSAAFDYLYGNEKNESRKNIAGRHGTTVKALRYAEPKVKEQVTRLRRRLMA